MAGRVAILLAAMILGGCASTQRSMLYFPDQAVPDPSAYGMPEMETRWIPVADGIKIHSWWRPARTVNHPVLVYFQGNAGHVGHRARKARLFLDRGYGVLLVSYRYNAGTGGEPGEEALLEDAAAAIRFVRDQDLDDGRIVLYGESLGTGVAVAMAAERQFAALVLESPYDSMTEVASGHYWFLPVETLLVDRYESIERIAEVTTPLLVLHGTDDRVIPYEHGRRLFDAAPGPKEALFIEGGRHNSLYAQGAGRGVLEFLERRVEAVLASREALS
jgi:fermentation-respiration switch protein FrsA (DUF1100 family)